MAYILNGLHVLHRIVAARFRTRSRSRSLEEDVLEDVIVGVLQVFTASFYYSNSKFLLQQVFSLYMHTHLTYIYFLSHIFSVSRYIYHIGYIYMFLLRMFILRMYVCMYACTHIFRVPAC
jgi:hypothetical protein